MPVANTVDEAAYTHLVVFQQPVQAWSEELRQVLPPFKDLYVEPPAPVGRRGAVEELLTSIKRSPATGKHLITGQLGSGKSWALRHIQEALEGEFRVVSVSATDHTGVTLPDVDTADVLLLLAEALAKLIPSQWYDKVALDALSRWVAALRRTDLPDPPSKTGDVTAELSGFLGRISARKRSDDEVRRAVRATAPDDLLQVVNALLAALDVDDRRTLLIFDDLDKMPLDAARTLFHEQARALARVNARMVMTMPFALVLDAQPIFPVTVLRNVKVRAHETATALQPEAVRFFHDIVGRLVAPGLVDESALEVAIEDSGGVPREFGRLLARAFELAANAGEEVVTHRHADEAARDLRVALLRMTQRAERRDSLRRVRQTRRLEQPEDHHLLQANLIVEYVNGRPWYDVHPLLAESVDQWIKDENR